MASCGAGEVETISRPYPPYPVLRKVLAGLVGALLGGLVALSLALLWGVAGWVSWLLVLAGAGAGLGFGDRGVAALARIIGWM